MPEGGDEKLTRLQAVLTALLKHQLNESLERVDGALRGSNYASALGWCIKGCRNLEGIDDLTRQAYDRGREVLATAREAGVALNASELLPFKPKGG